MKWLAILLTLSLNALACEEKIQVNGKTVQVCKEGERYFSKGCGKPLDCIPLNKRLKHYPNQNPSFSLCYQSGKGIPYFAKDLKTNETITVCQNEQGQIVDLESLMLSYKKLDL